MGDTNPRVLGEAIRGCSIRLQSAVCGGEVTFLCAGVLLRGKYLVDQVDAMLAGGNLLQQEP